MDRVVSLRRVAEGMMVVSEIERGKQMKITFYCDSGANIHSKREESFSVEDLGYTEEEWLALSDEEKQQEADIWANERLEIGYDES